MSEGYPESSITASAEWGDRLLAARRDAARAAAHKDAARQKRQATVKQREQGVTGVRRCSADNYRGRIPKKRRKRVYERDGHRCVECGSTDDLTLDHIIPLAKGGTNAEVNLQTMCEPCNGRKGSGS